jgi:hypothetical protein
VSEVEVVAPRRGPLRVATAMPLSKAAVAFLEAQLGSGVEISDLRDAVEDCELLLAPPCSPQAIVRLRQAFPFAEVVILELSDDRYDIDIRGPVNRVLAAGAGQYPGARDADALVSFLRTRSGAVAPADEEPGVAQAIDAAGIDDVITAKVAETLARRRAAGGSR